MTEMSNAMMTPDQERWAEALAIHRQHGHFASQHSAARIAALTRAGDAVGVARWREIAARLDQLLDGSIQ